MEKLLVYLGATTPKNPIFVEAVRELGIQIARRGVSLVFGGSREGTMTVLADTVLENGGRVIGVFTKCLPAAFFYKEVTESIITETLAERKETMLRLTDAVVALPGSFGTWDELFNALELAKIEVVNGRKPKKIAVLNINGYFDSLMAFIRHSVAEGYTTSGFENLLLCANTVDELFELLG